MTGINPDDVRKEPESLQRSHDTLLNGLLASNTTSDSSGASRQQTNNPELDAAYAQLASLQRSHDTLLHHLSATNDILNPLHPAPSRRTSTRHDGDAIFVDTATTSDDSTEDEDGSFVQDELPFHSFDHEHLREHLKTHDWTQHGWEILAPILSDPAKLFKQPHLFHTGPGPADDRSHYSHFQVYNVGPDGLPEPVEVTGSENMSKAVEIWHTLRNIGKQQDEKVVGRITIAREPSPILFGALHLTQNGAFDMDELFQHLVGTEASSAHMFRAFDESPRRHKTFVFRFSYYTLIGEECVPMRWQDRHDPPNHHVPLSRCSAVVALALHDDNPRRIRNRAKRAKTQFGWVTDVWSPWQVLQLESFPDWKSTPLNGTPYTFETGHKYLNGAEAFLLALLTEFRDARKRYHAIYQSITELVSPPARFLFSEELRRSRLFEDKDFTWISRYFFAQQTLIMVNDSMKSMIDAFEDTFTDDVWEGQNKMLWPLYEDSPRNDRWKRRLRLSRLMFERELKELRILMRENNEKGHEIEALREQLYSVTSIKESRKSVEQGNNIKVLTLVNLFFMVCQRCRIFNWHSREADNWIASHICNFDLRHDKHAQSSTFLAICNCFSGSQHTTVQRHRLPFYQIRLRSLDQDNENILAVAKIREQFNSPKRS